MRSKISQMPYCCYVYSNSCGCGNAINGDYKSLSKIPALRWDLFNYKKMSKGYTKLTKKQQQKKTD